MFNPTLFLSILWNAFESHIVLSATSEQILYAMAAFGGYSLALPFLISVVGGALAEFAHYLFGMYLAILWKKHELWLSQVHYAQLQSLMERYGMFLLLVFMFPLYPVLPMLAGFFRVRPSQAVLLMVVAQIVQRVIGIGAILKLMHT